MQGGRKHFPFLGTLKVKGGQVADKLLTFLSMEDMKTLSGVSKEMHQLVRNHSQFLDGARMHIIPEVLGRKPRPAGRPSRSSSKKLRASGAELTGLLNVPWKHLAFDLTNPIPFDDLLGDVFATAESVYVYMTHAEGDRGFHQPHQYTKVSHNLAELMTKTGQENLKTLQIELRVLEYIQQDLMNTEEVREVINSLHFIHIGHFWRHGVVIIYPLSKPEKYGEFFQQLALGQSELKGVFLGNGQNISTRYPDKFYVQPEVLRSILESGSTLEHLELHISDKQGILEKSARLIWPNLKSLTISLEVSQQTAESVVETIFKQQMPLEELDLCLDIISGDYPRGIFNSFQRYGVGDQLRKLHLGANLFRGRTPPVDWSFLKGMSQLNDFSLVQNADGVTSRHSGQEYDKAEEILEALPHPQIEKLRLEGFDKHFWRDCETIQKRNIGNLLLPFHNLRELHLSRNVGVITDEGLQSIISNFPQLQHFSFSGVPELTDYGITGKEPGKREKTGVSLDHLTGLVTLKIGSCTNVRQEGLLPVLRFQFLRSFQYEEYFGDWDPTDFLSQVASQNPSLEQVSLPVYHDYRMTEKIKAAKSKVTKMHPRLRLIQLECIVNCNA